MKNYLFFILILLSFKISAQDRLVLKNGEEKVVKVEEVGTEEIKYRKQSAGPLYIIKKSEVFMIVYADGTKDVFSESEKVEESKPEDNSSTSDLYQEGAMDATTYYRGHKSGAGGTLVTSLILSPVLGLIPAIACSSTPPNRINLRIPDGENTNNSSYIRGYEDQSHKIKKRKVWNMWVLGFGINLAAAVILFTE